MNSVYGALQLKRLISDVAPGVIALIGSGGKTTLMFHLARELERAGESVLSTTTTKIFVPPPRQSRHVIISPDPDDIIRQAAMRLQHSRHMTAASGYVEGAPTKLAGLSFETIRRIGEAGLFRWILVEADGSARRPLKAPARHEPVIPPDSHKVIVMVGLEAIGNPLNAKWVFRPEIYSQLSGLPINAPLTPQSIAAVLLHPRGMLRKRPAHSRYDLFLNQADNQRALDAGLEIASLLSQQEHQQFDRIRIGSLQAPLFFKNLSID